MPQYNYKCQNCNEAFIVKLPISRRDEPQACPECAQEAQKVVSEGVSGVLRGDWWDGKNLKVKAQMHARRARVGRRERDLINDSPLMNLAPNVEGERVGSWREATKLAASKGKDITLYEQKARKAGE